MTSKLVLALLICTALTLSIYAVWRLVKELGSAETIYRDRPALGFRMLWPMVNIMGNTFAPLMIGTRAEKTAQRLRQGGQEYALTPIQFLGGKISAALVAGAFGFIISSDGGGLVGMLIGGCLGFMYPNIWLTEHTKARNLKILKSLPFFLDIVTLSIEAGLNLTGALQKAVDRCPPGPLMVEINRVLRDIRAGKARLESLRALAERLDYSPVSSLVSSLVQGEVMGSSLGPILRAQSDQRRTERFLRAEKLAMEAPVKMLGPLILFIFPCTFIVIGFPIVMKFLASGY